eukprot:COSAG02_NODE_7395_length_3036_cov_1.262853_4_plen_196_part_00
MLRPRRLVYYPFSVCFFHGQREWLLVESTHGARHSLVFNMILGQPRNAISHLRNAREASDFAHPKHEMSEFAPSKCEVYAKRRESGAPDLIQRGLPLEVIKTAAVEEAGGGAALAAAPNMVGPSGAATSGLSESRTDRFFGPFDCQSEVPTFYDPSRLRCPCRPRAAGARARAYGICSGHSPQQSKEIENCVKDR